MTVEGTATVFEKKRKGFALRTHDVISLLYPAVRESYKVVKWPSQLDVSNNSAAERHEWI